MTYVEQVKGGAMSKSILMFGGSGFVGQEIGLKLVAEGHRITLVSRNREKARRKGAFPCEVLDLNDQQELAAAIEKADIVINLAGESLADGRWSEDKKQRIKSSRVSITRKVTALISAAEKPPELLIQASAVGYYGAERRERVTESSPPGDDFLANVSKAWEGEVDHLPTKTRSVIMRLGVVLGTTGGALREMVDVYAAGLGAQLGDGHQFFPWIHIDDVCGFVDHCVRSSSIDGVFNLVSPGICTNAQWHAALKKVFTVLSPLAVPSLVLKLVLGEKSVLVLNGVNAAPENTVKSGYRFQFESLETLVKDLFLGRSFAKLHYINVKQWVPRQKSEVWEFFATEKNLEKITPEFLNFHVVSMDTPSIQKGTKIQYRLKLHGFPMKWLTLIKEWRVGESFVDFQLKGPYSIWHHRHVFTEFSGGTLIEDFVEFKLPFWPFGSVSIPFVRKDVGQIFNHRQNVLFDYLG
jgi:hypothetical protein